MALRCCFLDLDGTLIRTTVFQALADGLGKGDEVRRLDALYDAGQMSLEDNFRAEVALFEGVAVAEAQAHVRKGPWLTHLDEGREELQSLGLRVGMLTDQPVWLAQVAGAFDPILGSEGGLDEQGRIAPKRIQAHFDKLAHLRAWTHENKVELSNCIHVGNGSNDIPVFERVGLAIAVNPLSPEVARSADIALDGVTDLREVSSTVAQARREGA